jgi:16S rRNA (cytosine967-C5)-methyltransferase
MPTTRRALPTEVPGLAPRRIAADILDNILRRRRPLDEQLEGADQHPGLAALSERDRALMRKLVSTTLRRLGTLRHLLRSALDRGLPADAPRVESVLLIGAVQILWLDVPDHAAVDLAVRLIQHDRRGARYPGLVNAVLRRIVREGKAAAAELESRGLDTPDWLMARWTRSFGAMTAQAIAAIHKEEPPLDITVRADPDEWAARLRGHVTPTGTVRTIAHGPVSLLPGYAEGAWWVQNAAAALPARLLGDVRERRVADVCAAPGGKTAQLAWAGARVTAVDRSATRLARLSENLARLDLAAETVAADATAWEASPFDAVLVDAPCSSTGTIRRHPDVAWLEHESDLAPLAALQRRLMERAVALTRPGGTVIYCVCSLEPEECEQVIAAVIDQGDMRRRPILAGELPGLEPFLTPAGDLRTLPCHWADPEPRMAGLDGFYAARLERV